MEIDTIFAVRINVGGTEGATRLIESMLSEVVADILRHNREGYLIKDAELLRINEATAKVVI